MRAPGAAQRPCLRERFYLPLFWCFLPPGRPVALTVSVRTYDQRIGADASSSFFTTERCCYLAAPGKRVANIFKVKRALEAIERRHVQVRGEHERPHGGHNEYVPGLETERLPLGLTGEPARAPS